VEVINRWWNKRWGRLARRDIWLKRDTTWRVEARQGDGHSHVWTHDYPSEADARAAIAAMIERTGGDSEWTQFTPSPPRSNGPATGQ
jgi:hypothetical protein